MTPEKKGFPLIAHRGLAGWLSGQKHVNTHQITSSVLESYAFSVMCTNAHAYTYTRYKRKPRGFLKLPRKGRAPIYMAVHLPYMATDNVPDIKINCGHL